MDSPELKNLVPGQLDSLIGIEGEIDFFANLKSLWEKMYQEQDLKIKLQYSKYIGQALKKFFRELIKAKLMKIVSTKKPEGVHPCVLETKKSNRLNDLRLVAGEKSLMKFEGEGVPEEVNTQKVVEILEKIFSSWIREHQKIKQAVTQTVSTSFRRIFGRFFSQISNPSPDSSCSEQDSV